MGREWNLFLLALQFFTRLPVPSSVQFSMQALQQSARYFTWVGAFLGLLLALAYTLLASLWPQAVAVILVTALGVYVTGAFHEDGFADMCDGFGGGMSRERVLEIMQDSRIGAYGAIGSILLLLLKCVSLAQLPATLVAPALLLAHPLSRLAPSILIWRLQYVRGEGKAKPLAQSMSGVEFACAAALPLLLGAGLAYWRIFTWPVLAAALLAMLLAMWWMGRGMLRRIGGFTGDCLGATQQVAEVAIYLALLGEWGRWV